MILMRDALVGHKSRARQRFTGFSAHLVISHYLSVGAIEAATWFRGKLAHISVNFATCDERAIPCDFGITRPHRRDCDFGPRLVHNAPCVELTGESLRPSKCVSSRGRAAGAFAAAGVARTSVSRCARIRVISDCMQTSIAVRLSSGRICKTIKGGSTVPTFSLRTPPL